MAKRKRGKTKQATKRSAAPKAAPDVVAADAPAGAKALLRGKPGIPPWQQKARRILRKLFWWGVIVGVVAAMLPLIATLSYKPASVHPVSTLMIWNRLTGESVDRRWIPFDDISPNVWKAVISSEDGQFCSHRGVDLGEMKALVDDALAGERVRGGSTIAMQTVKNLYLWSARSYIRKGIEVPLAVMVDYIWGKKRLMEIYLNIAEWGPGIYGIEAAAQHHFGQSARKLSRRQAALLAVTLPNPHLRNPAKPGKGLLKVARVVERRAQRSGGYTWCLR